MRITLHVRGSRSKVRAALAALPSIVSGRAADPTGLARGLQLRLGMTLLALVRDRFVLLSAGETVDGETWAPLAPATLRGRRKGLGQGTPQMLRDTGRLLSSLGPGAIEARPGEVVVATNVSYAVFQHEGVPGRIPARRLWPEPQHWPEDWWRQIGEQARDGLIEVARHLLRAA